MQRRTETRSSAETEALGEALAATLAPGEVVLIDGELGAGKTTFVRGACRALGVSGPITSPTFTIGQRYSGAVPVSHLDLYRLGALADEDPALLADYLGGETIGFVEWSRGEDEWIGTFGRIAYRVRIEHAGGDRRVIEIGSGEAAA